MAEQAATVRMRNPSRRTSRVLGEFSAAQGGQGRDPHHAGLDAESRFRRAEPSAHHQENRRGTLNRRTLRTFPTPIPLDKSTRHFDNDRILFIFSFHILKPRTLSLRWQSCFVFFRMPFRSDRPSVPFAL